VIKLIVLSVLLNPEYNKEYHYYSLPYDTEIVKMCLVEYTFNGYEDDVLEARRRGGKGNKKRRRGGNGLR